MTQLTAATATIRSPVAMVMILSKADLTTIPLMVDLEQTPAFNPMEQAQKPPVSST